jgi:hypothetical protein
MFVSASTELILKITFAFEKRILKHINNSRK